MTQFNYIKGYTISNTSNFFFREVPPNRPTHSPCSVQVEAPYNLARKYVISITSQEKKKHQEYMA